MSCFIGYQISHTGEPTNNYKYWDFERKCFNTSHNLIITVKFPKNGDFDEPLAAPLLSAAANTNKDNEIPPTEDPASTSQQLTPVTN